MKALLISGLVSLWLIFAAACGFELAAPEPATPTLRAITRVPSPTLTLTPLVDMTAAPAKLPADFDATARRLRSIMPEPPSERLIGSTLVLSFRGLDFGARHTFHGMLESGQTDGTGYMHGLYMRWQNVKNIWNVTINNVR